MEASISISERVARSTCIGTRSRPSLERAVKIKREAVPTQARWATMKTAAAPSSLKPP